MARPGKSDAKLRWASAQYRHNCKFSFTSMSLLQQICLDRNCQVIPMQKQDSPSRKVWSGKLVRQLLLRLRSGALVGSFRFAPNIKLWKHIRQAEVAGNSSSIAVTKAHHITVRIHSIQSSPMIRSCCVSNQSARAPSRVSRARKRVPSSSYIAIRIAPKKRPQTRLSYDTPLTRSLEYTGIQT